MKRLIQNKKALFSKLANKVDEPYKSLLKKLAEYNLDYSFEREVEKVRAFQYKNWKADFDLATLKRNIPECIVTKKAWRVIVLSASKLDRDNLEQSIKNNIHKNNFESWTYSKVFADTSYDIVDHGISDPVYVRLEATVTGLSIEKLYEALEKHYPGILEQFDINPKDFKESEIIAPSPDDYKIYNLDEIIKWGKKKKYWKD